MRRRCGVPRRSGFSGPHSYAGQAHQAAWSWPDAISRLRTPLVIVDKRPTSPSARLKSPVRFCRGELTRYFCIAGPRAAGPILCLLSGCDGAPSRNILGSYFPSWMVCALVGIALALIARAILAGSGLLKEIPVPLIVLLAIACAGTFALWLIWLS